MSTSFLGSTVFVGPPLSPREAAARLGVSPHPVRRWVAQGDLHAVRARRWAARADQDSPRRSSRGSCARPRTRRDRARGRCGRAGLARGPRGCGHHRRIRLHDLRHAALTNLAATGASPIAVMATAGRRSMQTTEQYLHLAGVVFRDDADALSRRLLGTTTDVEVAHG